jgi:hypothetical protein
VTCARHADEVRPGIGSIVILPMHGGRPLEAPGPVRAGVTLGGSRPEDGRRLFRPFDAGRIELRDLDTDVYQKIRLTIDVNPDNAVGMAGDHVAEAPGPWVLHRDGELLQQRVDTVEIMRLVEPDGLRFGLAPQDEGSLPAFHSPVELSWQPLATATSYRVTLWRGFSTRVFSRGREVFRETTTERSLEVELVPTDPGEFYVLKLEAYGDTGLVGRLETEGTAEKQDSYAFRIVQGDEPVVTPSPPEPQPSDERGTARLQIVPLLAGEPYALPARTWVRTTLFGDRNAAVGDERPVGGVAEFAGLPSGTYIPTLTVFGERDASLRRPVCRLRGGNSVEVHLANSTTTRIELPVDCEVRLLQPEALARAREDGVDVASPATFTWLPVPGATRYACEVQRLGYGSPTVVASGDTIEPTCTVALEPSILQERYRLVVSALGRRERVGELGVVFRVPGGEPSPGVATMVLVPTFDGRPLDPGLDIPVAMTLLRAGKGEAREVPARLANGVITLGGVETAVYNPSFLLDLPGLPQLSSAGSNRPVALLEPGREVRQEVTMYAPLEFLMGPPSFEAPKVARPMLRSPVTITWKPVYGATRYEVELDNAAAVDDDMEVEVRTFEVTAPSWTGTLRPTGREQYYTVIVRAKGTQALVGEWIYHFGVQGETPAP